MTDNSLIRDISFGDKGKEKYINTYDEKFVVSLIKTNPMRYWGGNNEYCHAKYNKGFFWIDIKIRTEDYALVYNMTKALCLERIKKETGIQFDTRIDLFDEYEYLNKELDNDYVAETEKESTIMTRIGQGKFRNRLPKKTGRKPYTPKDMCKLYIYGYFEGIRSSRKLKKECHRNIEVMWLMNNLKPDFKTIADFRKDNKQNITNLFKQFSSICNELGLYGKEIIAVDGSKFRANNSR